MSTRRGLRILVPAGLLLAAASLVISGCADPDGSAARETRSSSSAAVVPLAAFLAQVRAARYADYAGRTGVAARDEAGFEEMRRYVIQRYESVDAAGSIDSGGAVFDCVRQPDEAASPPPPATAPSGSGPSTGSGAPEGSGTSSGGCPAGTVPVRRITLDDLVRFPTLANFLGKGPAGESLPGPSPTA